jgi:zinc protease
LQQLNLKNGVEVFLHEDHFTDSVCIQCWVGVGSMMENDAQSGMSHFIEHMLFKGTQNLSVGEFARYIEAYGGSVNAYTTFDRTVYYLNISSRYAQRGVELLADCIFNSAFDAEEIEKEKEVVLEEIKRSLDDPAGIQGKELFASVYQGSTAGRPIIGTSAHVSSFTRDSLLEYFKTWYVSQNLRVVAVGHFDSEEMLAHIEKNFGAAKSVRRPEVALTRGEFPKERLIKLIKGDFEQPRLQIAFPAPVLLHADTVLLDLASFALGSGEMSRYMRKLRDEAGLVSSASAGLYSPLFGGVYILSSYASEEHYVDAAKGLLREAFKMLATEPITEAELQRARINILAETYYQEESLEGLARKYGFGLMTDYKTFYEDVYMKILETATPQQVTEALRRWLSTDSCVFVGVVPNKSKINEADLSKALDQELDALALTLSQTKPLIKAKKAGKQKLAERIQLDCGVELIYRQHKDSKLFNLVFASEGGSRLEEEKNAGIFNSMSAMLAQETENTPYLNFIEKIESHGADLSSFSGKDSLGFSMNCLYQDWHEFIDLTVEALLMPVFKAERWSVEKRQILQSLKAQMDSPSSICVRNFQEAVFTQHPYRFPLIGHEKSVLNFDEKKLLTEYLAYRDKGPWVITGVGSQSAEKVAERLNSRLRDWHPSKTPRTFASKKFAADLPKTVSKTIAKDREQTHLIYGFKGLDWKDADRPALDVLVKILGGQGGRLFIKLRDEQGLAYSVAPLASYGADPWAMGAYIACSPSKVDQALSGLKKEVLAFKTELATDTEVEHAVNYIVGNHELGLQKGSAQAMTMATMELFGTGFDDFKRYTQLIKKVNKEDVHRVARRIFDENHSVTVIVGAG